MNWEKTGTPCDVKLVKGITMGVSVGAVVGAAEAYARERAYPETSVNMGRSLAGNLSIVAHRAGAYGLGFGALLGGLCFLSSFHDNKPRPMDYALSGALSGFLLTLCVATKNKFKRGVVRGGQFGAIMWIMGVMEEEPLPHKPYVRNRIDYHSKAMKEYIQDKEEKKAEQSL